MQQDDTTVRNADAKARALKLKLIDEVISMYHTTRLSHVPAAIHILSKPTVQRAFAALSPADGATGVEGPDLGEPETRRVSALMAQYLSPGQAFCDHGSSYICVEVGEVLATGQIEVRCHGIVAYRNALQARSLA